MNNQYQKKGFTLVELLIVIGILAVLATTTVLVLNPAELFRQARDTKRINDLGALKSAVSLYLSTVSSPDMDGPGSCATNYWGSIAGATENFTGIPAQNANVSTAIDGTGWLPIDFTDIPGGSPLSSLPTDPLNPDTAAQAYTYRCDNTAKTFELNGNMESTRYAQAGSDDVESTDGGDAAGIFEAGNDPGLNL